MRGTFRRNLTMNATRLSTLSAAAIAVTFAVAGCATQRDDRAMQPQAGMAPASDAAAVGQSQSMVAQAPEVAPAPVPAVVPGAAPFREPVPMARAPADPVVTSMSPNSAATANSNTLSGNTITERAPRADRN